MALHPTTNQQRTVAAAHKLAATPPHAAVAAHTPGAPRQNRPLVVMSKSALMERVAQRSGTSVKASSVIVNALLETIREALTQGDEVRLMGFGSFGVRTRAAHTGVNPQTRARMQVPAKQHMRFSAGTGLSDAVAR